MKRTTHYGKCPHCCGEGYRWPTGWQDASTSVPPPCKHCGGTGRLITHVTEETEWPWETFKRNA